MQIQHDPDARSPAPRPSLLVAGASSTGRGEGAPPRFLDAVDGGRAPMAGPALHRGWKPAWLAGGVALLIGAGMVLSAGWPGRKSPAIAAEVALQPATAATNVTLPARGPARIERLETPASPRPLVLAASAALTPTAGAAQAHADGPAAVAATAARGPARLPMKRRQETVAADAAAPAEPAWTPAAASADPEPLQAPEGLQADADAELLQAVMDWNQRHPPALGRVAAPAARASGPP